MLQNAIRALGAVLLLALVAPPHAAAQYTPAPTTHKFPYAGGDFGNLERLERIPGRQFLDFSGKPTDAVHLMGTYGLNAVRVFEGYGQPLTTPSTDNINAGDRERNYNLDFGGVDEQVDTARRAKAAGMKVILTLQLAPAGQHIPTAWLNDTYTRTLTDIDGAVRQMLDPFLNAGIQPDIIIIGNEDEAGQLFEVVGPNNTVTERDQSNTNPYDNTATGIYRIWPKCTGYWKQEILSSKSEITKYNLNPAYTRFSVHTTSNPYRAASLFSWIFNNAYPDAEQVYYDPSTGARGQTMSIIPDYIRNVNLRDLLDIMGFSYYPGLPTGGAQADFQAALAGQNGSMNLTDDLAYFNTIIPKYGVYTSGPFAGQYKKQALVVEYGTAGGSTPAFTLPVQDQFTVAMFNTLAQYPWMLGAMWWAPEYANNNWFGSDGSLFRTGPYDATLQNYPQFSPISTLKVWGAFAAPNPNRQYMLTNQGTRTVLDIWQHSLYGGAWTSLNGATANPTQSMLWQFSDAGNGSFTVQNGKSGHVLQSGSASAGDHLYQWPLANPITTAQEWNLTPTETGSQLLTSVSSGFALDTSGGWGIQNPLNVSAATQQWQLALAPKFRLISRAGGGALDIFQQSIYGGAWGRLQAADDVNFSVTQQWNILSDDNGYYRIVNASTGFALQSGSSNAGDPVYQWPAASPITTSQEWKKRAVTGGYVCFVNRASGLTLDTNGNGFSVQNAASATSQTQQWQITAAP